MVKHRLLSVMVFVPDVALRLFAVPAAFAVLAFGLLTVFFTRPVHAEASQRSVVATQKTDPFMAQVVGLQWLNPLQRRDYPTEWQLLWTLGLVGPNKNDDMVRAKPEKYGKLQAIGSIAVGNDGEETFDGYHEKYIEELIYAYHDIYFMDSNYFYNAHPRENKSTWRELAGIHIEYALPERKLDPAEAGNFLRDIIINTFSIGSESFPNAWTRSTPPDVRITMGGANAGFTSLSAALDYLQAHPNETVWVMNWDAPSRPKDRQINENMVQLILAGPDYKTERAPLAWLGYPASAKVANFDGATGKPPRAIQAWKAAVEKAVYNAGKQTTDVGYVIHDANNNNAATASDRIAALARTVTEEMPELDFMKQAFNTPALLGEMGAGTALTNVALGIAYANHIGKTVLVVGTTDQAE
ncbi:virulence factor, partial [Massilia sp. Root335]|uniref:virulence factor n=1 Tax=Massilia sp. Root335 TaxID=1736517 RepID=UPI00138ED6FF